MTRFRILVLAVVAVIATNALAANPLSFIGETFSEWKARLFDRRTSRPGVEVAPESGVVKLSFGQPLRVHIGADAPRRDFPKGSSRYRLIELPRHLDRASVRLQVLAQHNPEGRGKIVFKPLLYVLGDDDTVRAPIEVKPLNLDIRPFRRTRLLACVSLDQVRRFVIATTPDAIGKSYETELREAVKAPTQGGFYYATDAVKTRLPFGKTGEVIIEVTPESAEDKGC